MQVDDERGDFVACERVAERGHVVAAVADLLGDLGGSELFADVAQVGPAVGAAESGGAVAVSAAFVLEEGGALGFLVFARFGDLGEDNENNRDRDKRRERERAGLSE